MSTLRRRILATAALPAAALGFLLAAPVAASASTMTPQATASATDHEPGHHYGLHLSILLGLHITGGHHDNDEGDCYDGLLGGGLLDLG
ncbi:hypothetical protein [Amycolatopsis sp. Hca4]|uniref:hypothetical protein n=1 Tax=Amycolatopsis sp. Hca4 TaxID=2742131 RepID=UPI0015913617|nr:hypothetical protein [Amycolatopsis sp. Hca4]QKV73887.1 hypothetical protein HUT10_08945 [Amycolatopsis sp. Hca4]